MFAAPRIACILLILAVAASTQAQSSDAKEQTASISGKVTLKSKPVAGIVVVAMEANYGGGWKRARHRATTDDEGNYRITDITPGNYYAFPLSPALAEKQQSRRLLTVAAGESIRDIDFTMVRGGVITGQITNTDGQPLIEESVNIMPVDSLPEYMPNAVGIQTDDRGIYRAFGLRPGKYKVAIGQTVRGIPNLMRQTPGQTFYPSVTELNKATVIEVTEGSETTNIDIVVSTAPSTFTASGRVIDSDGKPVPNVVFGVQQTDGNHTLSAAGASGSNSAGEFKLMSLLPGKYTIYIAAPETTDFRAEPFTFEVIDRDVTDLEIKAKKGASLSGMVVLEGSYEKSVAARLKGLRVYAWVEQASEQLNGSRSAIVGADGSFRIAGLPGGNAQVAFADYEDQKAREFEILRVEHNGLPQSGGVSLRDGEESGGVRIIVKHLKLTGAIRGQVKIENGELPPFGRIIVSIIGADDNPSRSARLSLPSPEVDSRGRFFLDRLAPGTYDVRASVFEPGKRISPDAPKLLVTVTDNGVAEVNITIKLKP